MSTISASRRTNPTVGWWLISKVPTLNGSTDSIACPATTAGLATIASAAIAPAIRIFVRMQCLRGWAKVVDGGVVRRGSDYVIERFCEPPVKAVEAGSSRKSTLLPGLRAVRLGVERRCLRRL